MSQNTPAELQNLVTSAFAQVSEVNPPDYDMLRKVVQNLADLIVLPRDRLAPPLAQVLDHLLSTLIPFTNREQKIQLARRLSGLRLLPKRTGNVLLNETIEISSILLESSVLLSDEDLIKMLTTQSAAHGRLIAMREGLSELVGRVMVEQSDLEVVAALIGNRDVKIGRASFKRLFELAVKEPSLRDPILDRADLPIDMAVRLLPKLNSDQRLRMIQRSITDRSIIYDICPPAVLESLSGIDGKIADGLRTLHRITPISREGQLSLIKVVQTRTPAEIGEIAGGMTGVAPSFMTFVMDDKTGDLFAVFAKGAGCSRRAAQSILEMLYPDAEEIVEGTESLKMAMRIFDSLSWENAAGIIRLWEFALQDVWHE